MLLIHLLPKQLLITSFYRLLTTLSCGLLLGSLLFFLLFSTGTAAYHLLNGLQLVVVSLTAKTCHPALVFGLLKRPPFAQLLLATLFGNSTILCALLLTLNIGFDDFIELKNPGSVTNITGLQNIGFGLCHAGPVNHTTHPGL